MTSSTSSSDRPSDGPSESGGYPRKRARTRRALIEAGMTVLASKGPDGATVGEIARAAHVSSGTFYNHFLSVDDLVEVIVGELSTAVEIGRDTLAVIENDPATRVLLGTRQLLDLVDEDPTAASAFVALLATVPSFRDRVRHLISGAVDDGIRTGRFVDTDLMALTDAVIGAVVQWMRSGLMRPGVAGAADRAAQLEIMLAIVGVDRSEVPGLVKRLAVVG